MKPYHFPLEPQYELFLQQVKYSSDAAEFVKRFNRTSDSYKPLHALAFLKVHGFIPYNEKPEYEELKRVSFLFEKALQGDYGMETVMLLIGDNNPLLWRHVASNLAYPTWVQVIGEEYLRYEQWKRKLHKNRNL